MKHCTRQAFCAALGLALLAVLPHALLAQESAPFRGEARVTAVDLLVDTGLKSPRRLENLTAADFEVLYDGASQPVVAVESPAAEEATEPWTIVIYFDYSLASNIAVRWAADLLAGQAKALNKLGRVEVLVADPTPRRLVAPGGGVEELEGALSQLVIEATSRDELGSLRDEYITASLNLANESEREDLIAAAVEAEALVVRRQQDHLLTWLTTADAAGARRALFLVHGGWALDPRERYGDQASSLVPAADLMAETQELARTLAAYGWITVGVTPPEPELTLDGLRIGKLRFGFPSRKQPYLGVGATFEEARDSGLAESFLELGTALRGQGKLDDAERAFRKAIYHFYRDPRTADRQAATYQQLGEVLSMQGDAQQARQAFEKAELLARVREEREAKKKGNDDQTEEAPARALGPDLVAPFEILARATAGEVARDDRGLRQAVESLDSRVRLTYQLSGTPDGRLRPVEVRAKGGELAVRAPGWARASTPGTVAAARARRLLAGEPISGELTVRAGLTRGDEDAPPDALWVEAAYPSTVAEEDPSAVRLRVTLAYGAPDTLAIVAHRTLEPQPRSALSDWRFETPVAPPEGMVSLAVVVEDLSTGTWGVQLLDLGPRDEDWGG